MPTKAEVFGAVLSERDYQEERWAAIEAGNGFMHYQDYIAKYTRRLMDAMTMEEGLHDVRKIAALCFAAMEKFGAPQREGFPVEVTQTQEDNMEPIPVDDVLYTAVPVPLSEAQLDALVPNESEVTQVERNVYYRTPVQDRTYYYPPNHPGSDVGDKHTFKEIIAFAVVTGGAHRLVDRYGQFYYVGAGWRILQVTNPSFV